MAYATQSDLVPARLTQQELIELTDDSGTGDVNADVVTAALARAAGEIDSAASLRYTLPLQATDQVKNVNADLATFFLFERRRKAKRPISVQDADTWGAAYRAAMDFLEAVREGKRSLDGATLKQTSAVDVATKDHDAEPDVFDSTRLKDW